MESIPNDRMVKDIANLKKKIVLGMFTLVARDFGLKILTVIGQIILIRLVAPEYFGIFAIITFLVSIAELFGDLGLTQAIIREKNNLTNVQLSTIFFVRLSLSVAAFLLLVLSFPVAQLFYKQLTPENFFMVAIFGWTIILKSIKGILIAFLDRELNFSQVSKIDFVGLVVYFTVAVTLAYFKLYLWNFIYAILIKEVFELLVAFYYKRWLPHLAFNISSIKKMIRYGTFLQIGNFISLAERSTIPIAGFRLSPYNLGLLDWGSNVAGLSNTIFENYGRAAFAGMAKIQDRRDKISSFVNKSTSLLNVFAFLLTVLILGFAREFTMLILSDKWLPALPSLYWFVSSTIFFGGSITIAHAILASGKSKGLVIISGCNVLFELLLAFLFVNTIGFSGIATASFIASFSILVAYILLGKKHELDIQIKKPFLDKFIVFVFTGILVVLLNTVFAQASLVTLAMKIMTTTVVYLFFLFVFSRYDIKEALSIVRSVSHKIH